MNKTIATIIALLTLTASALTACAQDGSGSFAERLLNNRSFQTSSGEATLRAPKRLGLIFCQTQSYDWLRGKEYDEELSDFMAISAKHMYAGMDLSDRFTGIVGLAGSKLTKENVLKLFDLVVRETEPGDEIVIYWMGHGLNWIKDDDGDEADGIDEALALFETTGYKWDGSLSNAESQNKTWRETSLTDDEMGDFIKALPGRRVFMMVEACFSGGLLEAKSKDLESGVGKTPKGMKPGTKIAADTFEEFAQKAWNPSGSVRSTEPERKAFGILKRQPAPANGRFADRLTGKKQSSSFGLIDDIRAASKDIGRDAMIAVGTASLESEPSWSGVFVPNPESEDGFNALPVQPFAWIYYNMMKEAVEKEQAFEFGEYFDNVKKTIDYTVSVRNRLIREGKLRIIEPDGTVRTREITQTADSIQNMPEPYLYRPQRMN